MPAGDGSPPAMDELSERYGELLYGAYDSAEVTMVPSMSVPLDRDVALRVLRLLDALEDLDDVQDVYANFDISDEVMAEVS